MPKLLPSFIACIFFLHASFAQSGADSAINRRDTGGLRQKILSKKDTGAKLIVVPGDTLSAPRDSISVQKRDSLSIGKETFTVPSAILLFKDVLSRNPWFNFLGTPQANPMEEHRPNSDEGLFYLLVGIVFYFALIKAFFPKYLDNLASLFLRASMRQQQLREQLLQAPLPSLLLNILFVITGGIYVCFLTRYYRLAPEINFWLLSIDCCILVGVLYAVKFLILKMTGWVFNIPKATDTYIFIVFMVNKIIGILLLPFLIVLLFSSSPVLEITVVISLSVIAFLFLYRFIASYPSVRNEIKISIFYFFLYLCAFEIAPLLLIYKVLLTYLEKAY